MTYNVKLRDRKTVAEGTMAYTFDKPSGFTFKPGQAVDVELIDTANHNAADARHTFSLISAPFEDHLRIATRMRDSAFKMALQAAPLGTMFRIDGPFGSLVLHRNEERPAVFIAGGIGITPFVSILKQAAEDRSPRSLNLIYSNRRAAQAAFLNELKSLADRQKNFRLVATITDSSASDESWNGETGRIDEALLKHATSDQSLPIYYVAGPPAMVRDMQRLLERIGIDDEDIRCEEFFGY